MTKRPNERDPVPEPMAHLPAPILEQLAEETLAPAEARDARIHLEVCGRCAAAFESHQQLFALLGELPRFAPSLAFNDAVMARVQIRHRESAVFAWLKRLMPKSRRGWILIGAAVTAPAMPLFALIAWILSQPLLSPATLWQWALIRSQTMSQASFAWLLDRAMGSSAVGWGDAIYSALQSVPVGTLGGVIAVLAVGIPLSGWGLVRLTRIPEGSTTYVR